jgi:hypothetical protein
MLKFLKIVQTNRSLVSLSLSYNALLEDQRTELTFEQIEAGQTEVELTAFNLEVVTCFQDFAKYNLELKHINLEHTGLIVPAIKYLASLLRKSQALQCLHLCGNEGITPEVVSWIRDRIHAKPETVPVKVRPPSAQLKYGNDINKNKGTPMRRNMMRVEGHP